MNAGKFFGNPGPVKKIAILLIVSFIGVSESVSRSDDPYLLTAGSHSFGIDPETFSLNYYSPDGKKYSVSSDSPNREIANLKVAPGFVTWEYPGTGISVSLTPGSDYLDVVIQSEASSEFTWPRVSTDLDAYTIPLHQGKFIPAKDLIWLEHLSDQGPLNALEALSMQFFALNMDEIALVFIIKNKFNNRLHFHDEDGSIAMNFIHDFPSTVKEKKYGFRIYPVSNDITEIAKTYKNYIIDTRGILSLEEKAEKNPDIRKLYGAPHIYVWQNQLNTDKNIESRMKDLQSLLEGLQDSGIKKAWIGLHSWTVGENYPEFVSQVNEAGYLIGPYDSYHSIHPPGEERWITATFDDTTLYQNAFVMNKRGQPVGGFLGEGRRLNPILSLPSVHNRTKAVFDQGIRFNSWFIDCDATGECYDDYTPSRMTSQRDDMEARLERMAWIRDTYGLVVGSETGNDFSANTIAYAHGMTTPVVAWGDPDMRSDSNSEYFVGSYYSPSGGIPARYVKPVPVKDKYRYVYFDNRFNLPLFQLVYNNAVITSHHWEWGSLKVPSEITGTMLKEILYNVPPLYHIDRHHWDQYKDIISSHSGMFAKTHSAAVTKPLNHFDWLTPDRLVQKTRFGETLEIIANFGTAPFMYNGMEIDGQCLAVFDSGSPEPGLYCP